MDELDYTIRKLSSSQINRKLTAFWSEAPAYPLEGSCWLDFYGKGGIVNANDGRPAFSDEPKDGYLKGTGPRGRGFYHPETRTAHEAMLQLYSSQAPFICCRNSKRYNDYLIAKVILEYQVQSLVPNDYEALQSAINGARTFDGPGSRGLEGR